MSDGFAYLDILFFAMVAAFIAFRLRNVLGARPGTSGPGPTRSASAPRTVATTMSCRCPSAARRRPVTQRSRPSPKVLPPPALRPIRRADPRFDPDQFLQGARAAFAMIVEAYAKGDKAALRPLLADEVFAQFAGAIDGREQAGRTLSTELVATRAAELVEAAMVGSKARVTVRFTSEQINLTRDTAGDIVEGDPRQIDTVVDLWTFERDTRSRDPNWQLVETGASA